MLMLVATLTVHAQSTNPALFSSAGEPKAAGPTAGGGRILLVLPFDNRSSQPSL